MAAPNGKSRGLETSSYDESFGTNHPSPSPSANATIVNHNPGPRTRRPQPSSDLAPTNSMNAILSSHSYTGQDPSRKHAHRFRDAGHDMLPSKYSATSTALLPTGESIEAAQSNRRKQIIGFPPITKPLPTDIQDEEIITGWPNHLWGPLLLRISANWTANEIAALSGRKIKSNTIIKRIAAAKKEAGCYDGKHETSKKQAGKRKRALNEEAMARKKTRAEAKSIVEEKKTTEEEATAEDVFESDASRAFRIRQEELVTGITEQSSAAPALQVGPQDHQKTHKTDWELLDDTIHERDAKKPRK